MYDEKLYAKSVKIGDNLLENYPNHVGMSNYFQCRHSLENVVFVIVG